MACLKAKVSERFRIALTANGKRGETRVYWEAENSERQMWDKHGHVVISAVYPKRSPKSL